MRFDHVASFIVNANHGVVGAAKEFCVADCVRDCVRLAGTTADRRPARRKSREFILNGKCDETRKELNRGL